MPTLQVYVNEDELVEFTKVCRKTGHGASAAQILRQYVQKVINDKATETVMIKE